MSEENKDNESNDVVKKEDYNKAIESRNSAIADKEKVEKELKEIKETKETEEKVNEEKKSWEKEKEEKDSQIAELKTKMEENNTKVSKGVVQEPTDTPQDNYNQTKTKIDELIPDREKNPEKFASNFARWKHYSNPETKQYTSEQLGMGLSLAAGAQRVNPGHINEMALKRGREDINLTN